MLARQKGNITQREIEWILILKLKDSFIEHVAPDLTSETLHRDKRLVSSSILLLLLSFALKRIALK